jgi:hypothetical protein
MPFSQLRRIDRAKDLHKIAPGLHRIVENKANFLDQVDYSGLFFGGL